MSTGQRTRPGLTRRLGLLLLVAALFVSACGGADNSDLPARQEPEPPTQVQGGQPVTSTLPPWRIDSLTAFEPTNDGRLIAPRLAVIVIRDRAAPFDETIIDLANRFDGEIVGAEPGLGVAQIEFPRQQDPLLTDLLVELNNDPAIQTAGLSTASLGLVDQSTSPPDWQDDRWDDADPSWPFDVTGVSDLWATGLVSAPDVGVLIADFGIFDDHPDLGFASPVVSQFDDGPLERLDDDLDGANGSQRSHGSHVAGTACGLMNGRGIVGVASGCELYGLDLLFDSELDITPAFALSTGTTFAVLMDRIVGQHPSIRVVNMSWGLGPHPANDCSGEAEPVDVAILNRVFADHSNVLWVASAGNCAMDIPAVRSEEDITSAAVPFPASATSLHDNVVAVTSVDQDQARAPGANAGPGVTVAAPGGRSVDGGRIWGPTQACNGTRCVGTYSQYSGTSMAAAHISGLAALLFQRHRDLSAAVMARCLAARSDDADSSGFGVADAMLSMACADRAITSIVRPGAFPS